MPRLGPSGVIAGVGASVSMNGTPLADRGTCAQWLSEDLAIANVYLGPPDRWELQTYQQGAWQRAGPPCNQLAAGLGRWLAWTADVGLFDATGQRWPAAGLVRASVDGRGVVGMDGTIGVIADRQAGVGVELWTLSGEIVAAPEAAVYSLGIGDASRIVWVENGQLRARGAPDPAPQPEPVSYAQPVLCDGVWYLLVTTNTRLILRQWAVALGAVVVPTPTGFNADATALVPGVISVAWSTTSGERPEDVQWVHVPVSSLTAPLDEATEPEPGPEPPDPEPPEPEPEPPQPYSHARTYP